MRYDLAIFDMDGTILNTIEDLADSLNVSLKHFGCPERSLAEVKAFVGNGIRLLIERGVPSGMDEERIDEVHRYFMEHYKKHCMDKTRPYEGIPDLLCRLRREGCRTAVVSNKADSAVKILADKYFNGLFDIAVGERPGILKKPSPDSVNDILSQLGIERHRSVYIGDSEVDIATARNACMDGIIVEWGFREAEFLREQGASVLVRTPEQLLRLIL